MFEPGDGGRVYNTVVAVGADGSLLGSYRKIHLYDAFGDRESARIQPGDGRTMVFPLAGFKVGVMTCYELRFPEIARHLAERGAEVLLLPAAWVRGPAKELHWETLARARAIENTAYVAACGQVSDRYCGLSAIYDPMGIAVVSGGETEELVVGDVSRERLETVRAKNPSLAMRRPDVYATWEPVRR
jgi:predicted amidohydrolase